MTNWKRTLRLLSACAHLRASTRARRARELWASCGVVAIALALAVMGCSGPTQDQPPVGSSTPSATPAINPPYLKFATIQYCTDSTGSYPDYLFKDANNYVANSLSAAVQANAGGFNAYVTYINGDPTAPASTPLVIKAPVEVAYPVAPPTPTPIPPGDVYKDPSAQARAAAQATVQKWNDTYPSADATITQAVNNAKASIAGKIQALRTLAKPNSNTSVWGCLYEASERFGNAPTGDKWLVIASDLQNDIPVDITKLHLNGVKIRVIYFYCQDSNQCQQTQQAWTSTFVQAGAALSDIKFYQYGDSQTIPLLLSGAA